MSLFECLDFVISQLLPAFFVKMDSFMIIEGVSVLGFSVGITVLIIVIGSILLRT